jgi:hypothetical protein
VPRSEHERRRRGCGGRRGLVEGHCPSRRLVMGRHHPSAAARRGHGSNHPDFEAAGA